MANIDRIVNVQISLNTTGITQLGFSTVLVVGAHAHSLSRVTSYTDVDEMLDDVLYRDAYSNLKKNENDITIFLTN